MDNPVVVYIVQSIYYTLIVISTAWTLYKFMEKHSDRRDRNLIASHVDVVKSAVLDERRHESSIRRIEKLEEDIKRDRDDQAKFRDELRQNNREVMARLHHMDQRMDSIIDTITTK